VLLEGEPAWALFMRELRGFVGVSAASGLEILGLTPSERAVLQLVAQGLDNQKIAQRLNKGEKTVRNQISAIFAKLGVRTRAEAIVRARDGASST
jgi:DNA-binding NarL/FixJ family response regulator